LGSPDDWSWKVTTSGAQPEVLLAAKFATGACAVAENESNTKTANASNLHIRFCQPVYRSPIQGTAYASEGKKLFLK
jgi:hypothetical protein